MKRLILISLWTTQATASSPSFMEDLAQRLDDLNRQSPSSPGTPSKKDRLRRELEELKVRIEALDHHCTHIQSSIETERTLQATDLEQLSSLPEDQQAHVQAGYAQNLKELRLELEQLTQEKKDLQKGLPKLSLDVAAAASQELQQKLAGIETAREQRDQQYEKNEQLLAAAHNRVTSQLTAAELAQFGGSRGGGQESHTPNVHEILTATLQEIKETEEGVWELSKKLTKECQAEGRDPQDSELQTLQEMKSTAARLKHEMGKLLAQEYPQATDRDTALVALLQAKKQSAGRPSSADPEHLQPAP